jgi:hypothetical protein
MKGDFSVNKIEQMLLEQMEEDKFHDVVNDDFSFADSLIDQSDLDKLNDKEDDE